MRIWLLFPALLPTLLFAQSNVGVSVTNYMRYGTGTETVGLSSQKKDYFENLLESRITISDFLVGFRLLHDAPPEFGREFTGLRKRYVEFRRDDLYIRAGDSFTLYGRGLALNSFENRALAFDTGIDGVKMEYKTRMMSAGITMGDINYVDVLDVNRTELYKIRAATIELTPYQFFSLGANFVSGEYRVPPPAFPDQRSQFNMPEYFGQVQLGEFDIYASYVEKRTSTYGDTAGTHTGTAFYSSASYTTEAVGITLEYKDYRFGIADPFERTNANRAKRAFAFQNAPTVHKEHSSTLLSRYPHVVDFNDEVGYQADIYYTFGQWTGNLNGSVASRHYSFAPTGDSVSIFGVPFPVYGSKSRSSSFLPKMDEKFSPFWEVYGDVQYYFEEGGTDYALLGFNRRYSQLADEVLTPAHPAISTETTHLTSVPMLVQYTVREGWVLKFISERQWVFEQKNPAQSRYFNHLLSLGLSKSPDFSVTFRYEFTSDYGTVDGRRNWTAMDFSFRLGASHLVTLSAGGNRGGLICANGVCRVVNPFLGFRASVLSYL